MFLGRPPASICGSLIDICFDETEVGPDLSVMGYRACHESTARKGGEGGPFMQRRRKHGRK